VSLSVVLLFRRENIFLGALNGRELDLKGRTLLKPALILTFSPGEKEKHEVIPGLEERLSDRLSQPRFRGSRREYFGNIQHRTLNVQHAMK
jgi:hypothetical protein